MSGLIIAGLLVLVYVIGFIVTSYIMGRFFPNESDDPWYSICWPIAMVIGLGVLAAFIPLKFIINIQKRIVLKGEEQAEKARAVTLGRLQARQRIENMDYYDDEV